MSTTDKEAELRAAETLGAVARGRPCPFCNRDDNALADMRARLTAAEAELVALRAEHEAAATIFPIPAGSYPPEWIDAYAAVEALRAERKERT